MFKNEKWNGRRKIYYDNDLNKYYSEIPNDVFKNTWGGRNIPLFLKKK